MGTDKLRRAIWDHVDAHIEAAPVDGLNSEGDHSDRVADVQRAYVQGLRAGRLAAMSAVTTIAKTEPA